MKKTLLLAGFMIVSMLFFAAGLLSSLSSVQRVTVASDADASKNFNRFLKDSFLPRSFSDSPISGQKTIVNGVEMDMWMGEKRGTLEKGFKELSSRWNKRVVTAASINKESGFMYGIDPKKKIFYGLMGFRNNNKNTFIPYRVDMNKKLSQKAASKDLPYQIKDKDMLSIQSSDKNSSFEYYFYEENMMVERALSYTENIFRNAGWRLLGNEEKINMADRKMSMLVKDNRTVVLNLAPAEKNTKTLVAVFMGSF